ncbi:MAG: TlpA family protein disulfide reductase [Bacteroidaceae bacterium]|nr:TlpA family protein disulfide reductase [Bacteroidaceae bacterium]
MNIKKTIITILLALVLTPVGMEAQKKSKKVKAQEVPQLLNYPSAEWGEYRMHGGEVVIKGHVTADNPAKLKQLNNNVNVIIRDHIVRKKQTIPIKFEEDGTFLLYIRVPYPMFVLVYPLAQVFACPGDTVELTYDATKPMQKPGDNVTLSGKGVSAEASKLFFPIMYKYLMPMQSETHVAHPDSLLTWRDAQVARLDDLVRQMNAGLPELESCSPRTSDVLRTFLVSQYLYEICHRYYLFMDFLKENEGVYNIDKEAYWQQYFSFLAPREKYLLGNPLLMVAGDEFFFNRMEYTLMEPIDQSSLKGSGYPIDFFPETAEIWAKEGYISLRETRKQAMNELHEKLHLSPTNFCAQVCMVRDLFYKMEWGTDYDAAADEVANTLPYITNPDLMRRAVWQYREFVKVKEAEKQFVDANSLRPSSDVEGMSDGEKILRKLIEAYQGKIIYVDIWGTWCAPCRENLKESWRVREALKDYDIVYLFLANNSSDEAWKSIISEYNLTGPNCIHYNLPADQQSAIERYIGVNGYPTYKLIDKKGNIHPVEWQHTENMNSLIEIIDRLNK